MHSATRGLSRGSVAAVAAIALTGAGPTAFAAPGVAPSPYSTALEPGQSVTLSKTVETPVLPPNPDIVFLADTTTSMTVSIGNVQANASSIVDQILADQPTAQFAVADYKDVADFAGAHLVLRQQLTDDTTAVTDGIEAWTPLSGGGADAAEDWIGALGAIPSTIDFRDDGAPVVVMFGDSTSHDPSAGFTLESATSALQAAGVRVIAISVPGADGALWNGLDSAGQASAVTSATGGTLATADPEEVSEVILAELQNLPAVVTHSVSCDPGISVSLTPASQTVTSGGTVSFQETVTLSDAPQGQTVSCEVSFLVNGQSPGPEFVQDVDVEVLDVTPPAVTVESRTVEATGPDGATVTYDATAVDNVDGPLTPDCVPPSGSLFPLGATTVTCAATDAAGNTGSATGTITIVDTSAPVGECAPGRNPGGVEVRAQGRNGFFELHGSDVVDTDPQVYVRDTGSGTVFGPYPDGQLVKYTEAPGGEPRQQTMPGGIVHLFGTGDAETYAVDFSGNSSAPVSCDVPPPRK